MIKGIGMLGGQFGDAIVCTVAVRAFKQLYPESQFTFAVAEKFRDILPLLHQHPLIDGLHVWESYDAAWPNAADEAYIRWRDYDWVANALCGHSQHDWYNHRTYGQEACVRYGLPVPADISYELVPWMTLRKDCSRVVTLSLFPSKGAQMDKTMPLGECEKLCVALRAKGYTPIQLGGRFEPTLNNAIAPSMSILEATTLMLSSRLHITADTAFASIAGGYNHPALGFYSRNYPDMLDCFSHLPPNRNAHYLRNVVTKDLTAAELLAAIEEKGLLPA